MKGVTRSFWILVAITLAFECFLLFLAVRSLRRILPCWWSDLPAPDQAHAACGASAVLVGYYNWVPAALIVALFAITVSAGAVTLLHQVTRTRSALNSLGERQPLPDRLVRVSANNGATVELVDDPRPFCCCAGLIHSSILISTSMLTRLDDAELLAVLAHEASHVRRRDPARAVSVADFRYAVVATRSTHSSE
jgi:Zn-dependent protease with chaperone function